VLIYSIVFTINPITDTIPTNINRTPNKSVRTFKDINILTIPLGVEGILDVVSSTARKLPIYLLNRDIGLLHSAI